MGDELRRPACASPSARSMSRQYLSAARAFAASDRVVQQAHAHAHEGEALGERVVDLARRACGARPRARNAAARAPCSALSRTRSSISVTGARSAMTVGRQARRVAEEEVEDADRAAAAVQGHGDIGPVSGPGGEDAHAAGAGERPVLDLDVVRAQGGAAHAAVAVHQVLAGEDVGGQPRRRPGAWRRRRPEPAGSPRRGRRPGRRWPEAALEEGVQGLARDDVADAGGRHPGPGRPEAALFRMDRCVLPGHAAQAFSSEQVPCGRPFVGRPSLVAPSDNSTRNRACLFCRDSPKRVGWAPPFR